MTKFLDAIKGNKGPREILEASPSLYLRYSNQIHHIRSLYSEDNKSTYSRESYAVSIPDWTCHWHLWGPPDKGKTQFAKAQFDNPLYVRHVDQFCDYDSTLHDGIVVDELSFTHWPAISVINMLNKKDASAIHCRYRVANLPAGIRIIFLSNKLDIFYDSSAVSPEESESINAKIFKVHIDKCLWEMTVEDQFLFKHAVDKDPVIFYKTSSDVPPDGFYD